MEEEIVYTFTVVGVFWGWFWQIFVSLRGLSLVAVSGGCSSLQCVGFSSWWLLLSWSTGSKHVGFSSCSLWALVHGPSSCGARA